MRHRAGIEPSVGRRGDSYDNALTETINGLYKAERIRRRALWKTHEAVERATPEWAVWFNHHRWMEPLGYIPLPERIRQLALLLFRSGVPAGRCFPPA